MALHSEVLPAVKIESAECLPNFSGSSHANQQRIVPCTLECFLVSACSHLDRLSLTRLHLDRRHASSCTDSNTDCQFGALYGMPVSSYLSLVFMYASAFYMLSVMTCDDDPRLCQLSTPEILRPCIEVI